MSDAGKAAQSAREVVARHLEALEEYHGPMVEDVVASDGAPLNALVKTTKALRALLAQPPSDTVARLVEAAGEVADSLQSTKQHIARAGAIAVPEVERLRATPTGDLADAASALAETRAQLERANGDLARLRADALSVGGGAVRKAYDVCHAALDDVKAPKTGSCAERIDEARRERHAVVRRARQRRRRRGRW